MSGLKRDDAYLLIDRFDLWIHEQVGRQIEVKQDGSMFQVRVVDGPDLEETEHGYPIQRGGSVRGRHDG
jgi:hypothetical protein